MSLADLTRSCFQNGISPEQWTSHCQMFIGRNDPYYGSSNSGTALSNSVISLYHRHPGDTRLHDYLRNGLDEGMISVVDFVATLLQAVRSPELRDDTLDILCKIALDTHRWVAKLPMVSYVAIANSHTAVIMMDVVQDAFTLLRTVNSSSSSRFHTLLFSTSKLIVVILSWVPDISRVSASRAALLLADANDILHTSQLLPDVRQALQSFALSLSFLIGNDAKVAREAQMMQTLHLALGKKETLGPDRSDVITCTMLLQALVTCRGGDFGPGCVANTVAMFFGMQRWNAWSTSALYTHLLIAAFTCTQAQNTHRGSLIWKSFMIGRLPFLLLALEKVFEIHGIAKIDCQSAMQASLSSVFEHFGWVNFLHRDVTDHSDESHTSTSRFIRRFLHSLVDVNAINSAFIRTSTNSTTHTLQAEAYIHGQDMETYLNLKLIQEQNQNETDSTVKRICQDPGSHVIFAKMIQKHFLSFSKAFDVELLGRLSRLLFSHNPVLDILSVYITISLLISEAMAFLSGYDCETVGDPQTALSHLGNVVLFVQVASARFQLMRELPSSDFAHFELIPSIEGFGGPCTTLWFKALFDTNSEGIEDTILRSTNPTNLLIISSTVFSHAIRARYEGKMDQDVFSNGISYFMSPLLKWTLVSIVKVMLSEIQRECLAASVHIEVLRTLLLSPSCPPSVLNLCGADILKMLSIGLPLPPSSSRQVYDLDIIRNTALQSLAVVEKAGDASKNHHSRATWMDQPRKIIHGSLALTREGKAPYINLARCLTLSSPMQFVRLLWYELNTPANVREMEACRNLVTSILVMPQPTTPLLPLFLHIALPVLISAVDQQQPPEKLMSIELLAAIVSSSLTAAMHIECASQSVLSPQSNGTGQSTTLIAMKLGGYLRSRSSCNAGAAILQRLSCNPSFMTNFPAFMMEL
ncbi:hypothetical protein SERLA73DRAFT_173980 [Serpula lacrymans var. lacrymans S7.3]|uniref:Mediator of RNA polymerase II transcription subunit 5 n=2 Tax=Serpula lacrymans var. lacrymans TaxID=341189 RepID=F8PGS0_SERL3|nr:uncharacterized protein SERLADRAFT_454975 [Serpula lacrymans var. lacrymans S7.9]EGO04872.1 hypothetical protein SERLA73DRAFT_173980 [Serpula lacrymans var. lacrymans S7.3]EGO30694.1 hypothetical protein SERLADRAFT_454975 [Serpula lacrymans var. lacrymans S7.9]